MAAAPAPYAVGETVYALNPKYKDGTRLRAAAADQAPFNHVWVPNDSKLKVLEIAPGYVHVQKTDGERGWMRERNVTRTVRVAGVTKDVVSTEIVTPDPEYVKGIKIYGVGIKEDPVSGSKFGKGIQHLISSHWLLAMSQFVGTHFTVLQAFARHAEEVSRKFPGYDYVYFANYANHLFEKAALQGLHSQDSQDLFLMATWLVMAAAEVDDFPIKKWTPQQRRQQRLDFYAAYLSPRPGPGSVDVPRDDGTLLGKFAAPISRRDLLPPTAMDRLGLNNELSGLKYADPELPLREGFLVATRIDSLKRHFDSVHRRAVDEDHITHLLWNFMAIYHVLAVFPEKNNLTDFTAVHGSRVPRAAYDPTTSLEKIAHSRLPLSSVLKLDWNEGAIPPPPRVSEALIAFVRAAEGSLLKWYPHLGGGEDLRSALAAYCGVIPENLLVTNGSDDALILVCHAYLGNDKTALVPVPTYEHFCVNAACTGAALVRLELADPFAPTSDAISAAIELNRPTVAYLVSPNNPTGAHWAPEAVRALALRYPEVLFLVDEAYHEFAAVDAATKKPVTCVRLATELSNVIVTRTFSKAFCLAALRCGYLIAHPNTIEKLRAYYNPKSVNQFAQIAATHALKELNAYYLPYIHSTNEARNSFLAALQAQGVTARSGGGGNFVCVHVPGKSGPAELCKHLESKAIYVRDISSRFPGYVRITIGLEMSRVTDEIVSGLRKMGVLPPAPAGAAKPAAV